MKIIISPAKTMHDNEDGFDVESVPMFINEARILLNELKQKSSDELKMLMKCSKKIADLNYQRFQNIDLETSLTPALFAYEGLQYKVMAPHILSDIQYNYLKNNLCILSGFYGLLKVADGIYFYRLEMQTEMSVEGLKNLYEFWGSKIYEALYNDNDVVVNLASKEYSSVVEKYLNINDQFITCTFGNLINGKVKVKGTLAKMARGAMVRYMAEYQVKDLAQLKEFRELNFKYSQEHSTNTNYVFLCD